ncbi:MAG: PaaI family thioesterase [Halopseudomonas sp.]
MNHSQHYLALANMYKAAPINAFYPPTISIDEGATEIELAVKPEYFHTAGAMHGSVYFKMLDDAAFFAVNSLEFDVFVLTTSFTTYITRPISSGNVRAVGRVVNRNSSQFIAEAVLYDDNNREIARGNGIFVRSRIKLAAIPDYCC